MQKITVDVEMADGTEFTGLRVVMKDMIRYSDVRARHKWPLMEEDQLRFAAFLGYAAMTRLGHYDATKGFDEFQDDCLMVAGDFGDELPPTP